MPPAVGAAPRGVAGTKPPAASTALPRNPTSRQSTALALPATDATRASALSDAGTALSAAQSGLSAATAAMEQAAAEVAQANAAAAAIVNAAVEKLALLDGAQPTGAGRASLGELKEHTARAPVRSAAAVLRDRLKGLSDVQLEEYLTTHLQEAQILARSSDRPVELQGITVGGYTIVRHQGPDEVEARLAGLDPSAVTRLALLYPAVMGDLDGVPLPARVAANRVKIASALADQATEVHAAGLALSGAQARLLAAQAGAPPKPDDPRKVSPERTAYDLRTAPLVQAVADAQARLDQSRTRQRTLEELLHGTVVDPARKGYAEGDPRRKQHQVLVFDPSGDGKVAELWGTIDADTQHVAVYVPGTTTDIDSFAGSSAIAQRLTKADESLRTTAVAWLGMDMPNSVPKDAPFPHYAREGAQPLDDFVAGLQVPREAADTTVIGHSYGAAVVGQADHLGLRADKVVLVEPGGAGPDVHSTQDFDTGQTDYTGAEVQRYTMTAPGDIIRAVQGLNAGGLGLGADPNDLKGMIRLETGRYGADDPQHPGELMIGPQTHSDVFNKGSTSWDNIVAVVLDRQHVEYSPPVSLRSEGSGGPDLVSINPYWNPLVDSPPAPGAEVAQ